MSTKYSAAKRGSYCFSIPKSLLGIHLFGCSRLLLFCASLFVSRVAKAMLLPHASLRIKLSFVRSKRESLTSSKYGISGGEIGKDGLSSRLRKQLDLGNTFVGWLRFVGRILIKNIPGRAKADEIEKHYIEQYRKRNGRRPRGNKR